MFLGLRASESKYKGSLLRRPLKISRDVVYWACSEAPLLLQKTLTLCWQKNEDYGGY